MSTNTAYTPYETPESFYNEKACSDTYNPLNTEFKTIETIIDDDRQCYIIPFPKGENTLKKEESPFFQDTNTISVSDMIIKIQDVFGLKVSQLADILKISRATIYNHLGGKEPGSSQNYTQLYKLAIDAEKIRTSYKGSLKSIMVDGKTLLKHLKSGWQNSQNILSVCEEINKKIETNSNHPSLRQEQKMATRRISIPG